MKNSSIRAALVALCLITVVAVTACQKKAAQTDMSSTDATTQTQTQPVAVAQIDLGKGVGADNRVTDPSEAFTPGETVYATVVTNGAAPSAELKTVWTFQDGQIVDESVRTIAPTGEAATEFHITKPAGLPIGKYKVEVFLNGASAGTKEFEVKRS
jgi:Flp pilus assembly protein CpaB